MVYPDRKLVKRKIKRERERRRENGFLSLRIHTSFCFIPPICVRAQEKSCTIRGVLLPLYTILGFDSTPSSLSSAVDDWNIRSILGPLNSVSRAMSSCSWALFPLFTLSRPNSVAIKSTTQTVNNRLTAKPKHYISTLTLILTPKPKP